MNPNLAIQNIMTTDLVTVKPDDRLVKIRQIFSENKFHHIPVVGFFGDLLGIISRSDFYKVTYVFSMESMQNDRQLESAYMGLCASDIMTKYPLNLEPDDTVGLAADIFLANKFHALPIIESGKLVGIVTSHDLLAYCFKSPVEPDLETAEYDEN